jgi:hypothetical protein
MNTAIAYNSALPENSTVTKTAEGPLAVPFAAVSKGGALQLGTRDDRVHSCLSDLVENSTAGQFWLTREPVFLPKRTVQPRTHFIPLEKREGIVLEIGEGEFEARLIDTLGDEPEVTATFSFEDLSEDGRRLLEPGAVFYFNVGYSVSPSGQRSRVADLVFRRLPGRRNADVAAARRRADKVLDELGLAP